MGVAEVGENILGLATVVCAQEDSHVRLVRDQLIDRASLGVSADTGEKGFLVLADERSCRPVKDASACVHLVRHVLFIGRRHARSPVSYSAAR